MELAKLKISKITNKGSTGNFSVSTATTDCFTCQFNPESFKLSKKNKWTSTDESGKNMAALAFGGGEAQNMTVSLTFDTTSTGDPVFEKYEVLYTLSSVDSTALDQTTQLGEPPWVMVQWGSYMSFAAVITSVEEEYTMFKPNGTPIRAKVSIGLRQVADASSMGGQNPTSRSEPRRTWVVQEGQRLDWIAFNEYGESSAWRVIAEENGIDDPFNLRAGQVLRIPMLSSVR